MAKFSFQLNGRAVTVDSWDPAQPLLYVLRNSLGLHGPKFGCGLSQCGACTVLIDGKAARSCVTPVRQAAGHTITTLEGLGTPEDRAKLLRPFPAERMECWPVGKAVGNVRNQGPELIARAAA